MKKKTVQVIYEIEKKTNMYRKIPKISPSRCKPHKPVTQKTLRPPSIFSKNSREKISTEVQRVLEDAFKKRKLFSSIFSKFGVVPNSSTQGKLNHIKHT